MFVFIWGADYPDAHNFFHDVLGCKMLNASHRPCSTLDAAIEAAGQELVLSQRVKMYAEVETMLFGKNGEFPIAPIRILAIPMLVKPWLSGFFESDGLFAGRHWNTYRIDQAMQLGARNKP
jgi:ABC-type oligopeptide transport system substrate-binding subunit